LAISHHTKLLRSLVKLLLVIILCLCAVRIEWIRREFQAHSAAWDVGIRCECSNLVSVWAEL